MVTWLAVCTLDPHWHLFLLRPVRSGVIMQRCKQLAWSPFLSGTLVSCSLSLRMMICLLPPICPLSLPDVVVFYCILWVVICFQIYTYEMDELTLFFSPVIKACCNPMLFLMFF